MKNPAGRSIFFYPWRNVQPRGGSELILWFFLWVRQCSQQAKLQNIESMKEGYDNCCELPWQPHSSQLPRHPVQLVPGPELTLVIDFSLAKPLLSMPPSNGATVAGFKVVEHVECRNITRWNAWKILQITYRYTTNGSFSWKQKDGY